MIPKYKKSRAIWRGLGLASYAFFDFVQGPVKLQLAVGDFVIAAGLKLRDQLGPRGDGLTLDANCPPGGCSAPELPDDIGLEHASDCTRTRTPESIRADDLSVSIYNMPKKQKPSAPTPLAGRLRQIMDEMKWTQQTQLARAAKVPRQTVYSWLTGDNENMQEPEHALNLQAATKFNAMWIMTGKGDVYVTEITPSDARLLKTLRGATEDRKTAVRVIFPDLDI